MFKKFLSFSLQRVLVIYAVPMTTYVMSSLDNVNVTALGLASSVMSVLWDNGGSLGADHVSATVMHRGVTL